MPTYAFVPPNTPTQYPAISLVNESGTVVTPGADTTELIASSYVNNAISNTVAETTAVSITLPGQTVNAGDMLRFMAGGTILQNIGSNTTFTLKFKIGTTTILSSTATAFATSVDRRRWGIDVPIGIESSTAQRVFKANAFISQSSADTLTSISSNGGIIFGGSGTAAENTATNKSILLTVTMSQASAQVEFLVIGAVLTLVRQ